MDKNAVLGELLYVISRYEKGRITTSKVWRKKYIFSLKDALQTMEILVSLLKTDQEITVERMLPVIDYCKRNIHKMFPEPSVDLDVCFEDVSAVLFQKVAKNSENDTVIDLMENIVTECRALIERRPKNYKIQLSYLLRAFHNLPKVFLDPTKQTLFNIAAQPISRQEGIEYALFYIDAKNNMNL